MCGRYTLTCPDEDRLIANLPFDAFSETRIEFRPRYNIAPGQRSPVIYLDSGKLILADALWGFARSTGVPAINARSETAERTPMFRDVFRNGRCLVPADGFLEWRREGRVKQPYLFRTHDRSLFLMAGLWKAGRYVVLTRDSAGEVEDIHNRMPVILSRERARQWLTEGELSESPPLTRTAVSAKINRIENDDPSCIEPLAQGTFEFD